MSDPACMVDPDCQDSPQRCLRFAAWRRILVESLSVTNHAWESGAMEVPTKANGAGEDWHRIVRVYNGGRFRDFL